MDDRLWVIKPPWHLTSHLGQLNPPSLNRELAYLAGVKSGCVHLCWVAVNTVILYGK